MKSADCFLSVSAKVIVLAGILLAGCKVGPNYERPKVEAPNDFRFSTMQTAASIADLPWWEVFNDPELQGLIRDALQNNYDVRIAVTRIEQADALKAVAGSQFFPQVGYGGGISRGKNQFAGTPIVTGGSTENTAVATLNASWELDLWGRIRRLNESAQAQLIATEEVKRGVMLTLVSNVSQAYFELLELDLQLQIAHDTTESFQQSLKLFTNRLQGGVGDKLAVSRAQAALSSTAAQIPELERQIALKENQINVLLGRNPGPVARNTTLLQQAIPPEVPAGLPSALLERRPDIRQAEQLVISANAQIGVAKGNFFPQIGLTTFLGKASPDLKSFSNSSTTAWAIAANLAGPLYTGGALSAQLAQAEAAWRQTVLQYEQIVLNAFLEVADALISREKFEQSRIELAQSVSAYQDAVKVATERYNAGKANYYEVLEAQQQLFPAENSLAQTELAQRLVIIQLYNALGGGYKLTDEQFNAQPTTAPTTAPATTAPAASAPVRAMN